MRVFAVLFFVALASAARADDSVDGDPSPGGFWLTRLELRGSELILTRSREGPDFSFKRDGASAVVASPPGSMVKSALRNGATFFGRESTLVLIPAKKNSTHVLFLTEATNRRGDVHAGMLLRSPTPAGRITVDDVTYIGILPRPLPVRSKSELAAEVASLTE